MPIMNVKWWMSVWVCRKDNNVWSHFLHYDPDNVVAIPRRDSEKCMSSEWMTKKKVYTDDNNVCCLTCIRMEHGSHSWCDGEECVSSEWVIMEGYVHDDNIPTKGIIRNVWVVLVWNMVAIPDNENYVNPPLEWVTNTGRQCSLQWSSLLLYCKGFPCELCLWVWGCMGIPVCVTKINGRSWILHEVYALGVGGCDLHVIIMYYT